MLIRRQTCWPRGRLRALILRDSAPRGCSFILLLLLSSFVRETAHTFRAALARLYTLPRTDLVLYYEKRHVEPWERERENAMHIVLHECLFLSVLRLGCSLFSDMDSMCFFGGVSDCRWIYGVMRRSINGDWRSTQRTCIIVVWTYIWVRSGIFLQWRHGSCTRLTRACEFFMSKCNITSQYTALLARMRVGMSRLLLGYGVRIWIAILVHTCTCMQFTLKYISKTSSDYT